MKPSLRLGTTAAALSMAAFLMTGCAASDTKGITNVLDRVANTGVTDLEVAQKVALSATPPDQAGADCAGGVIKVAQAMQKIAQATSGQSVGAFTVAEIATLYQPGSPQFEWATTTIESACLAKFKQSTRAMIGGVNVVLALPTLLALAPAV